MTHKSGATEYLLARWKRYATYTIGLILLGAILFFVLRGFSRVDEQHLGDFRHFYWAAEAMRNGLNPYLSGAPGMRHGYIYPPLVAWLYVPLSKLSMGACGRCVRGGGCDDFAGGVLAAGGGGAQGAACEG